ncbi:MAG: phosphoribosyl-ATP diphosphatase [Woeseiaceae bacterium]
MSASDEQEDRSRIAFLGELDAVIRDRLARLPHGSYTTRLAASGARGAAQKVGEEAVELALAAVAGTRDQQLDEAADLVYHLQVLLAMLDLSLADVAARLALRRGAQDTR